MYTTYQLNLPLFFRLRAAAGSLMYGAAHIYEISFVVVGKSSSVHLLICTYKMEPLNNGHVETFDVVHYAKVSFTGRLFKYDALRL